MKENGLFNALYGNDSLKEYFTSAVQRGSLSHTYILEGPPGSGKHTLASLTACLMAPDFADKILGGNEPDVIIISREKDKKSISVDAIRDVKEKASLTPNELDFLYFIIEDAETMTFAAQNSFLKLLEEPPRGVYMLLLCSSVNGLLPTVLSRTPVMRMQLFSEQELSDYLLKNNKKAAELYKNDREAFDFAVRTASGSIGGAVKRMQARSKTASGEAGAYRTVGELFSLLSAQKKAGFFTAAANLPQKREELDVVISCLEEAARDLILAKAFPEERPSVPPMFYADSAQAETLSAGFTEAALREIARELTERHEQLDRNVNIRLLTASLASGLWKAART